MKPTDAAAVRKWKKSQELVNQLVLEEARSKSPEQRLLELEGHLRLRATLAVPQGLSEEISFSTAWSTAKDKLNERRS